uniref:NADH-ubiquinone oxidoreductase chain 3 n=1 Tax=Curculionoidea sp. 26 KM-2017 TaxID=2219410 RepID=A0A346RJ19_9CUCU|nr:NADH dehydrogenase subunit 3 [Curculionoidea sp. 26 KM-2017]
MKIIMLLTTLLILIIMMLIIILNLTSKKTYLDREKASPFECGFDPKNSARLPFSLQFFLIAMIFLIFDVELTLLLPFILLIKISNIINLTLTLTLFILLLILGIFHEWNQNALNWKI